MTPVTRMLALACGLAGSAWLAAPADAQEGGTKGADTPTIIAIEARWLFFNLDGSTKVTDTDLTGASLRGTTAGFADEFDLDQDIGAPELAFELNVFGGWGVVGSYLEIGTDGASILQEDIVVDGKNYSAGDYVSDALDLRYGKALIRVHLVENLLGFSLGPLVGAGFARFDQDIDHVAAGSPVVENSHETGRIVLPQAGAAVHFAPVDWFFADFEASGGYLAYDGNRGAWLDGTLGIYFLPMSQIAIGGGVRFIHMDLEKVELDSDFAWAAGRFTVFGVYIGLEIRL